MGTVQHQYAHSVEAVFAKLTDEAHLRERSEQAGHRNIEVRVQRTEGGVEVRLERDIESEIPAVAKKFINPVNHVVDVIRWRDDGDAKSGTYQVTVSKRIRVSGVMSLRPTGDGCRYEDTCTPTVDVPIVGKKIAKLVAKETETAIAENLRRTERALG